MEQIKMAFPLVILIIIYIISLHTIIGMPNANVGNQTTARDQLKHIANVAYGFLFGYPIIQSVLNSLECSEESGCHEGYCWAWCGFSLSSGEWCYTTKTHTQSHDYVTCKQDSDCDKCWKCGGPCALI